MNIRYLLVAGLGVVFGIGLTAATFTRSPINGRAIAEKGDTPAASTADLVHESAQPATVVQRQRAKAVPAPSVRSASDARSARPESTRVNTSKEAWLDAERGRRVVEAYDADTPGSQDSRKIEYELGRALSNRKVEGIEVQRLECRAHSCRADMEFGGPEADNKAMLTLMRASSEFDYSVIVPTRYRRENGHIEASAYLFAPNSFPQEPSPEEFPQDDNQLN